MNALRIISYILVLIGAINWGLVGMMNFDFVALIFGEMTVLSRIIYSIIGIAAIILLLTTYRDVFYHENY
jgi:uncharacterized membrane protein YuzA (DUF378 family)